MSADERADRPSRRGRAGSRRRRACARRRRDPGCARARARSARTKTASSAASASSSASGGAAASASRAASSRSSAASPRSRTPAVGMGVELRAQLVLGARSGGDAAASGSITAASAWTAHASRCTARARTSAPERAASGGAVVGDPAPRERAEEADRVVLGAVALPVAGDDLLALARAAGLRRRSGGDLVDRVGQRRRVLPRHRLAEARVAPPPRAGARTRRRGRTPPGPMPGTRRCARRSRATAPSRRRAARDPPSRQRIFAGDAEHDFPGRRAARVYSAPWTSSPASTSSSRAIRRGARSSASTSRASCSSSIAAAVAAVATRSPTTRSTPAS